MDYVIVKCPHCSSDIIINKKDFNCKIFRHGIFKSNFKQINPHLNKIECDKLINDKKIYGCGKPFKLIIKNNIYSTIICDYI